MNVELGIAGPNPPPELRAIELDLWLRGWRAGLTEAASVVEQALIVTAPLYVRKGIDVGLELAAQRAAAPAPAPRAPRDPRTQEAEARPA